LSPAKRTSLRNCGTGVAVLVLTSCASAVVIDTEFPTPLIDQIELSVGLFYEQELRDFIHAEALPRSTTWTIDLGDANVAMLKPLFTSMFSTTRELESFPPTAEESNTIDAVLASALNQFQFDVPRATRDEFVEVWLEYRLQLVDGERVIIEWFAPGYGKAEIDGDREDAVQRAAVVAMREAGAVISTQFAQQPEVLDWLRERDDASEYTDI
jgi:hypothetical protein